MLLAPIKIGEDNYVCEVVIKQGTERQGFYLHEVELSKKFADVFKTATGSTSANSKLIIAKKLQKSTLQDMMLKIIVYIKKPFQPLVLTMIRRH